MCRCNIFRRLSQPANDDNTVHEMKEKPTPKRRNWSAIFLTVLRFLQLAYFAFAYCALFGFQRSGYFRHDSPWQRSPDHRHDGPPPHGPPGRGSMRMMRWVRTQVFVTLVYHIIVLVVPALLRILKSKKRAFISLITVFGDGCAVVAMLNSTILLDGSHERYCHSPPGKGAFSDNGIFSFAKPGPSHHHKSVCRALDVVFGLGGLIILSYLHSVAITIWRASKSESSFAKVQEAGDVEQGMVQHAGRAEGFSSQAASQRQHSPPPPYHPDFPELAQESTRSVELPAEMTNIPRSRTSVETTTSSLGVDAYLVADGWRAPEEPPVYSSRPPSLHATMS